MISEYNKTKSISKKIKLGKEIFREEIQFFHNIYKKRYLPLEEVFKKIEIIGSKPQASELIYTTMLEHLITGLKDSSIKLIDLDFDIIKQSTRCTLLWKEILVAQRKELENIEIIREKSRYNFIELRKSILGRKILDDLGINSRFKLEKEEFEKVVEILKSMNINMKLITGYTESEKIFDSKRYYKNNFKDFTSRSSRSSCF